MIKIAGVKYNKLVWTAINAVFERLMTVAGASPADRAALKSEYLDPITYLIDSDGDGIPDAFDPTPRPVQIETPFGAKTVERDLSVKTLAESVAFAKEKAAFDAPKTDAVA